jgi:hypothetical protein
MAARGVNTRRLVFLIWVLVAAFYFYLAYGYIRVSMSDRQFADYLHYVVQIAGNHHRPANEVRTLLLVKAEQLSLPVTAKDVKILGEGEDLNVNVDYDAEIEIPLIQQQFLTKKFAHKERYIGPR